jgi:hypothetical protein
MTRPAIEHELEAVVAALDRLELYYYVTAGGVRGACPICAAIEGHDRNAALSARLGDSRLLLRCFRCEAGYGALAAALGINGRAPALSPEEIQRRRSEREQRDGEARVAIASRQEAALRSPRRSWALAHAQEQLLADPTDLARLGCGELDGRLTFAVYSDDGALLDVCRYAMPSSPARAALVDERRKLLASPGGRRDLWPRPRDARAGELLPGTLILCEGPPCAVTLAGDGLSVVSYPSASGLNRADAARVAAWVGDSDERVVLLPDCEDVGRRGAKTGCLLLRDAGVRDVQVIDVAPGRDDGRDAADIVRELALELGPVEAGREFARRLEAALR